MKALQTLLAAALVSLLLVFSTAGARLSGDDHGMAVAVDAKQALRQDMRKLWTDHSVWTRLYVVSAVSGLPDKGAAATRLLKNQEDIGNAVGGYYGKAAGEQLTVLLKEHITIAVDLIDAAKADDAEKTGKASAEWTRNALDISEFLNKANPNWSKQALVDMMNVHLSTTIDEVKARLAKNWDADVKAYDEVYAHILKMADMLSEGIIKQFPERFKS